MSVSVSPDGGCQDMRTKGAQKTPSCIIKSIRTSRTVLCLKQTLRKLVKLEFKIKMIEQTGITIQFIPDYRSKRLIEFM